MVPTMEATFAPTLTHKDAVVVVGAKLGAEEFAEVRNHVGVVKQILEGFAPERDSAGNLESVTHFLLVSHFLIGNCIEFIYFGLREYIFDNDVSLQVKYEFFFGCHGESPFV